MPILSLGVSYRHASVDLLERLAFSQEDLPKAYDHLTRMRAVNGGVILSTCNRIEVVGNVESYHSGFQELKQFLCESREVAPEDFEEPLYSHYEDDAAEHVFSITAGIDSMVTGEPQILSQVRAALKQAEAEGAADPATLAFFRFAVRAGRRARKETGIEASPGAFVEAGASLADDALGGLSGKNLLVLGAGGMGDLAARHLRDRRMGPVRVLNRSVERAQRLARRTGGSAGALAHLPEALRDADLVVSSTGASGVLVDLDTVREAVAGRKDRPLFFLDLAVPRDVDPRVGELPGVEVVNIDRLGGVVATGDEDEVKKAFAVVRDEVGKFGEWRRAAALSPLIQALHDRGEKIRGDELRRAQKRLENLSEDEREAVEAATKAIVAKLLHDPVVRTKRGEARAAALAELFGIEAGE
ncbi:MAG: glutamyl-tRNA reductase [Actinomycetota bacterium]